MKKYRYTARGFTFLEIMLVVVIIGILAATIAPRLIGRTEKAQIAATRHQIENFKTALQLYEADVGSLPTTEQGLKALKERPSDVLEDVWDGPYMKAIAKDSWKRDFIYRRPGEHDIDFDLYSGGPNRTPDDEDDITSWVKEEESF